MDQPIDLSGDPDAQRFYDLCVRIDAAGRLNAMLDHLAGVLHPDAVVPLRSIARSLTFVTDSNDAAPALTAAARAIIAPSDPRPELPELPPAAAEQCAPIDYPPTDVDAAPGPVQLLRGAIRVTGPLVQVPGRTFDRNHDGDRTAAIDHALSVLHAISCPDPTTCTERAHDQEAPRA